MTMIRTVICALALATAHAPLTMPMSVQSAHNSEQIYLMLLERFNQATQSGHVAPELVRYIVQFLYFLNPVAIIETLDRDVIVLLFNKMPTESVSKMALRLVHAQKFKSNISGDLLSAVGFVKNPDYYGVNGVHPKYGILVDGICPYVPVLLSQPYLEYILPLLELLIKKPVTKLVLADIKLTDLPAQIGDLVNLQELNLACNKITTLSSAIGKLVNLEVLNLFNNYLKDVPEEIYTLENLKELDCSGNFLTKETKDRLRATFKHLDRKLKL